MNTCRLTPDLVSVMTARKEMIKVTTSEEEIKNDALSHQPEMFFGSMYPVRAQLGDDGTLLGQAQPLQQQPDERAGGLLGG